MTVQTRLDNVNLPFIRSGSTFVKEAETVVQDAGRTTDMAKNTVMAYDPATQKWNSFTDETATDGTQFPRGILLATLSTAEIVAGDVVDVPILVGGCCTVDSDRLVIENSKTLDTVINEPLNTNTTVEVELRKLGIFVEAGITVDRLEN